MSTSGESFHQIIANDISRLRDSNKSMGGLNPRDRKEKVYLERQFYSLNDPAEVLSDPGQEFDVAQLNRSGGYPPQELRMILAGEVEGIDYILELRYDRNDEMAEVQPKPSDETALEFDSDASNFQELYNDLTEEVEASIESEKLNRS